MWEEIQNILHAEQIPDFGIIPFASVQGRLLPCRALSRLPREATAIIVCLFPYRVDSDAPRNLSRYACVPDYHRVIGETLQRAATRLTECLFAPCVPLTDNSPIPEVYAAALAGLGCVGDNRLLIHPRYGSYVFIGTIVTNAPLDAEVKAVTHCLHCGMCRAHCPTAAIQETGVDTSQCLSAVSQRKGSLTAEEAARLRQNGLVWGCDRCQEVCPLNLDTLCEPFIGFNTYTPFLSQIPSEEELKLLPYGWRGRAVLERNLAILQDITS